MNRAPENVPLFRSLLPAMIDVPGFPRKPTGNVAGPVVTRGGKWSLRMPHSRYSAVNQKRPGGPGQRGQQPPTAQSGAQRLPSQAAVGILREFGGAMSESGSESPAGA